MSEPMITKHIDLWSSAILAKSSAGRGGNKRYELYGIKKLRELILELAVRGKLLPQDPNDEPASVLLKKIAAEKAKLIKDGKMMKQKSLPRITDDEKPFELPKGWEWCRLQSIAEINPRNTNVDDNTDVSFVPMTLVSTSYKGTHETESSIWAKIKKGYTHFANGDIAIAKITPCFQNSKAVVFSNLTNGIGAGTTELLVARPIGNFFEQLFILLYLKSPNFLMLGESLMTGTAGQKRVPKSYFESNPLPLPPLAEQARIVAKVDELMGLCDRLEQESEASIEAHEQLVEVLLASLSDSEDASALADNWARISEHFDTLFTSEKSIDALKQTVLQLAVMGKLVPQNPNDEPASVLLKKIAAEKAKLVKDGKIKKQKPLPKITDDEKPFELPQGWEWCRFSQLSLDVSTGPFGLMINKKEYIQDGIPLINPSHMINGIIVEDRSITVSPKKAQELSSYRLSENDLVMARRGEMGRCAIVRQREDNWLCGTGSFYIKFNAAISRPFIVNMFRSSWIRKYLSGNSIGSTMTNLNHSILNRMPVMLPPPVEQHRIVAKVDELMGLCDRLKAGLQAGRETQVKLTDAIVDQAL